MGRKKGVHQKEYTPVFMDLVKRKYLQYFVTSEGIARESISRTEEVFVKMSEELDKMGYEVSNKALHMQIRRRLAEIIALPTTPALQQNGDSLVPGPVNSFVSIPSNAAIPSFSREFSMQNLLSDSLVPGPVNSFVSIPSNSAIPSFSREFSIQNLLDDSLVPGPVNSFMSFAVVPSSTKISQNFLDSDSEIEE